MAHIHLFTSRLRLEKFEQFHLFQFVLRVMAADDAAGVGTEIAEDHTLSIAFKYE